MSFRTLPLLRLLFFFITGIITADLIFETPGWVVATGALFVLVTILLLVFNWFCGRTPSGLTIGFLVLPSVFVLGWMITTRYQSTSMKDPLAGISNPDRWIARVESLPGFRAGSIRYTARLEYVFTDNGGFKAKTGLLLYLPLSPDSILKPGERIAGYGALRQIKSSLNPEVFDYKTYLKRRGITRQVWLKKGSFKIQRQPVSHDIFYYAEHVRQQLLGILNNAGYDPDVIAVASAILLGYDDLLDPELRQTYTGSGAIHVLCVSGLHLGIFYAMIAALLFPLSRTRKGEAVKTVILLILIWGYACITGLSVGVARSATMFTFVCIGGGFRRRTSVLNSLVVSAFFLLSINPYYLFDVGFQLSFAAVAGIVIFHPVLSQWFLTENKVLAYGRDLIIVSIAAQMFTAPVILYKFHQFPNYFLLSSMIAIPLSYLVLVTGIATFLLSWIPWIGDIVSRVLGFLIGMMNDGVSFIEGLPGSVSHITIFGLPEAIILWIAVLSILYWIVFKKNQGFILFLISMVVLGLFVQYQCIKCRENHFLVIADGGKNLLFGKISGRRSRWFGTSKSPPEWTLNGMNKYYAVSPEQSVYQCISSGNDTLKGHFIVIADRRIVIIDSTFNLPKGDSKLPANLVLIGQRPRIRPEWILSRIEGAIWVIGNTLTENQRKRWEESCRSTGATCYRLDSLGALEISLR